MRYCGVGMEKRGGRREEVGEIEGKEVCEGGIGAGNGEKRGRSDRKLDMSDFVSIDGIREK